MANFSFRKIFSGLNIVPKATLTAGSQGDLEVSSVTGKAQYHNGTTESPIVTEAHSATLTNKTISGSSNTITNIGDSSLTESYIKADGTRKLTNNWTVGTASGTGGACGLDDIDFLRSNVVNPASSGFILMAKTDHITWRNNANSADLQLSKNTSDLLTWNLVQIPTISSTDTLTNKTISGSDNTLSNIADGSLSTSYIKADGTRALTGSWDVGAFNISANSFISRTTNPASAGVVRLAKTDSMGWRNNANDGDILLSKNTSDVILIPAAIQPLPAGVLNPATTGTIQLSHSSTIGWRNQGNSGDIQLGPTATDGILSYNSVDLVGISLTQTLTNKTISGSSNTLTNIALTSLTRNYLSQVSTTLTGITSNTYIQMSALNYVTLTPGIWNITGAVAFDNDGTSPVYTQLLAQWASANGDNTGTPPSSSSANFTIQTSNALTFQLTSVGVSQNLIPTSRIRVTVTGNANFYLVPYATSGSPTHAAITTYIYAEQLG